MSKLKFIFIALTLLATIPAVAGGNKRDFDIRISGDQSAPRILGCQAPEFSFHLPQMAGNFRMGIAGNPNSRWGSELKEVTLKREKNRLVYVLKDPLLNNGKVTVKVAGLSDSDGIIVEAEAENIPEQMQLIWSFGGCYGQVLENKTDSRMEPAYCKYNVFSVEGTAFTVYYGESMNLKVIQGVTPLDSRICLSDAHQQQTPLTLFQSGKVTDAPALAATVPLKNKQKLYFCFYTQNSKADYNYYLLPETFEREFNKK